MSSRCRKFKDVGFKLELQPLWVPGDRFLIRFVFKQTPFQPFRSLTELANWCETAAGEEEKGAEKVLFARETLSANCGASVPFRNGPPTNEGLSRFCNSETLKYVSLLHTPHPFLSVIYIVWIF